MPDIWMDVDAALSEVPVNILALTDDTDFKARETGIVYNQAGMDLVFNFVTSAGAMTQTAVTPTTGGDYDWAHQGDGMYSIEIPAAGGASINNDTEGFGWFTGYATGVLPWRGPVIGFRAAGLNNVLIDSAYSVTRGLTGTALPAAAADAAGGLPVSDAGGLDLDTQIGTDIDEILVDTAVIGALGAGLTAVPWNSAWDAEVQSEVDDALVAQKLDHLVAAAESDDPVDNSIVAKLAASDGDWSGFSTAADSLEAIRDRGDAAWTTGSGTGLTALAQGTAQGGASGSVTLAAGESATSNLYNGTRVAITGGTGSGQSRLIVAYDGGTKVASVTPDWTTNPDNTSDYEIQAADGAVGFWRGSLPSPLVSGRVDADVGAIENADPTDTIRDSVVDDATRIDGSSVNAVEAKVDTVDGIVDAILVDTDELQAELADGGRTDVLIDTIDTVVDAIKTKTDNLPTDPADDSDIDAQLATIAGYLDTEVAAVLADTNELQGDLADGGRLDLILDAVLADTNELQTDDVPGLISALNDIAITDITGRQVVDSIPADGTLPTWEQAIYMVVQFLYERSVSGTTVTVKKVDGSSTLLTLTLDDQTDPTSITRAT